MLESVAEASEKRVFRKPKGGIIVEGVDDVAVRFGKCCSPIPGDDIVGLLPEAVEFPSIVWTA